MKTERFASAVRMSMLYFGHQSVLPIRYLTPDIGDGLNIETSFLLLKVCRTKVIMKKIIFEPVNCSEDV